MDSSLMMTPALGEPPAPPAITTTTAATPPPPSPLTLPPTPRPTSPRRSGMRRRKGSVDFDRLSPRALRRVYRFCGGGDGSGGGGCGPVPPLSRLSAAVARSFHALPAPDEGETLIQFARVARAAAAAAAAAAGSASAGGLWPAAASTAGGEGGAPVAAGW